MRQRNAARGQSQLRKRGFQITREVAVVIVAFFCCTLAEAQRKGEYLPFPMSDDVTIGLQVFGTKASCKGEVHLHSGILTDGRSYAQKFIDQMPQDKMVVRVDPLGTGKSSKPKPKRRPDLYNRISDARINLELIDRFPGCGGGGSVDLVCHSYGCLVVMEMLTNRELAIEYQGAIARIGRLVLIAPPSPKMTDVPASLLEVLETGFFKAKLGALLGVLKRRISDGLENSWYKTGNIPDVEEEVNYVAFNVKNNQHRRATRKRIRDLVIALDEAAGRGLAQRLEQVDLPILVVAGEEDRIVSIDYARGVHVVLPNSRLHIFEETGHSVHRAQPERVGRLAGSFLSEMNEVIRRAGMDTNIDDHSNDVSFEELQPSTVTGVHP